MLAACAASAPLDELEQDATISLSPQSFVQGTDAGRYSFRGRAGELIWLDAWGPGPLKLILLDGSKAAAGTARNGDARHPALSAFRLPRTGTYVAVVSQAQGPFTLRYYTMASHLPRQEGSQLDLTARPGPAAVAAREDHEGSPHRWTDAEVDGVLAELQAQPLWMGLADAQVLLSLLRSPQAGGPATTAQLAKARAAAARLVGTPEQFRKLPPQQQACALQWLQGVLFDAAPRSLPAVDETLAHLQQAWPGARQESRRVLELSLDGQPYGFAAEWTASLRNQAGAPLFDDAAQEWFDARGGWLGELSDGAVETDDG